MTDEARLPAGADVCKTCNGLRYIIRMIPVFNGGSYYEKPGYQEPCPDCTLHKAEPTND